MRTRVTGTIETVYRDQGFRLQRAVALYAGSQQIAEDAVAEAFAQALERASDIRDPSAWVWRVSFRLATRELARSRRTMGELPEQSVEAPGSIRDLVVALRSLSPKQRASVVLHHYAGYSTREIAKLIGSSAPAVTVHLSNGRKRLRHLLEEHDG
ncbi:MAG TPA: sigma-70 family RNA polymerase sigma factor [Actinomycetota bacterium]